MKTSPCFPNTSRFTGSALLFAALAVSSAWAQNVSKNSILQTKADQQDVRQHTTILANQIQSLIDELTENGITGDDVKVLATTKAVLNNLSTAEMQRVLASLQKAGDAAGTKAGEQNLVDAYGTQKGIILEFRQILKDYEQRQAADELPAKFKELTDRQTQIMWTTAQVATESAGKSQQELNTMQQTTAQIVQTDQNALVNDVAMAKQMLDRAAQNATGEQGRAMQQAQKDLAGGNLQASLDKANADLGQGHLLQATTAQKAARDTLRQIAKDLNPPTTTADALSDYAATLNKIIEQQKDLLLQTNAAIDVRPRVTGLDEKQGVLVDQTNSLQEDMQAMNPAVAGLVKDAITPMQVARATLGQRSGQFPRAASSEQDAIDKLQQAAQQLAQLVADAQKAADEAAKDSTQKLQQLQQQIQQAAQAQKQVAQNTAQAGNDQNALNQAQQQQNQLQQATQNLQQSASPLSLPAAQALANAQQAMQQAQQALSNGQSQQAQQAQQQAAQDLQQADQAAQQAVAQSQQQATDPNQLAQAANQLQQAQNAVSNALTDAQQQQQSQQANAQQQTGSQQQANAQQNSQQSGSQQANAQQQTGSQQQANSQQNSQQAGSQQANAQQQSGSQQQANSQQNSQQAGSQQANAQQSGSQQSGSQQGAADMQQAQQALAQAAQATQAAAATQGLPDAAQSAIQNAQQDIAQGQQAATQGNAQATANAATAAQSALAQAQAAVAVAQAGMTPTPSNSGQMMAGQNPGQPPGQPQPGDTPPTADQASPDGAKSLTGGSNQKGELHDTTGNGKFITVMSRERAAITETQAETRPQEYSPMIDQYLKNLSDQATASSAQ
ncbi:MAG TPA: hypothetical protein VHY09_14685 [Candidatus Methylacidiphilales bacterium]|jgi:hypothetical protein|nr:hypothetical protein [Candidatus Methylacidiphilales bacterium]